MVALNPDYAPVKSASRSDIARQRVDGTSQMCPKDGLKRVPGIGQFEPQNRVGDFFARNGDRVGTHRPVSRIVIRGKYDVASTMASGHSNFEYGAVTAIFSRAFNKKLTEIESTWEVLRVGEVADLPGGGFADAVLDKRHEWLAVYKDGELVAAAGLGNRAGIPGEGGQSSPDSSYVAKTFVVDHASRMSSDNLVITKVSGVDAQAVLSHLNRTGYGKGPWSLGKNDCNTWCDSVIQRATPQRIVNPVMSSPGAVVTPNVEYRAIDAYIGSFL